VPHEVEPQHEDHSGFCPVNVTDNVPHEVEQQHEEHSGFCTVNPLSLNDDNITLCEGDIVYFSG
jgi:hypothetical protein